MDSVRILKNTKKESIGESPVYRLSDIAAFEAFDDGALILNLEDVTFTELNLTACDILLVTDGKNSLRDVAAKIAREYEIEVKVALTDTMELYDVLDKQGLIEVVKNKKMKEKES